MTTKEWWRDFYDPLLAAMLLEPASAEVDATVTFLERTLELAPGDLVFDQCCGLGRLSLALAQRGYRVVGVDLAADYIAHGNAEAESRGLPVELVVADAFQHVPRTKARGAFNWWTSFGYADDDARNAQMLARAFDALAPGGIFALDYPNLPALLRRFERSTVDRRAVPALGGEVTLVRESAIDVASGVLRKRWTYLLPSGERVEHYTAMRCYMPDAIARMLRSVGFDAVTFHGGVDGSALGIDSERCIARAWRRA